MGSTIFTGSAFTSLTRALDAASLRHDTIAGNLANVNTPGYRRHDVAFSLPPESEDEIGGDAGFRASGAPMVVEDPNGPMRSDGNSVDPDAESAHLAENEITYSALTQALSAQFSALRIVITGNR